MQNYLIPTIKLYIINIYVILITKKKNIGHHGSSWYTIIIYVTLTHLLDMYIVKIYVCML